MEKRNKIKNLLLIIVAIFICPIIFSGCDCKFSFLTKEDSLTAPVITADTDTKSLQWYNTGETNMYSIHLNGEHVNTINSSSDLITYDYSELITDNAEHHFTVVASASDGKMADSEHSNTIIINTKHAFTSTSLSSSELDYSTSGTSTITASGANISWSAVNGATGYIVSYFTNDSGLIEVNTPNTSYTLPSSPHEIVAYIVSAKYSDGSTKVVSPRINYYNPDGKQYVIKIVDGYLWDYYINSKEELNAIVYYNFICRLQDYNITFDSSYVNEIVQDNNTAKESDAVINEIEDSLDTFYETCYFDKKDYSPRYAGLINSDRNEYRVSINYFNVSQCDLNQPINSSYLMTRLNTGLAYYDTYDFGTSSRSETYDDFVSDDYMLAQDVTTSEQLYMAVENKVTPICAKGSRAEDIYSRAKAVLREIISDNMTDYEKALSIFDWITYTTLYDYGAGHFEDNHIVTKDCCYYLEGVFIKNVAVCDGFSKAYSLMCNMEGIDCVRIVGDAKTAGGFGGHAWNKVRLDGRYYIVDITWTEIVNSSAEVLSHKYFLVTDYTMMSSHIPYARRNKFAMYPTGINAEINYYTNINYSYISTTGDKIDTIQYIDSTEDMKTVLDTPLLNNASHIELAVDVEYINSLKEKHNETDAITALQKEFKATKYTPQLLSIMYDSSGGYLDVISISEDKSATVIIMESSLLVNEANEIENIIQYYGDYATHNSKILNASISIGIDISLLEDKYNITLTSGNLQFYLNKFMLDIDNSNIMCEYTLDLLKDKYGRLVYSTSRINDNVNDTIIYYYTMHITSASMEQLATPQLSLEGSTISWQTILKADYYEIYINDTKVEADYTINSDTCYLDLSDVVNNADIYSIYIVACADGYRDSANSNTVEYVILSPITLTKNNTTVEWTGIDNAVEYQIYVNDILTTTTLDLSYDLSDVLSNVGTYKVHVVAVYNSTYFSTSNELTYLISQLSAPNVSLENNIVSWQRVTNATAYEIYNNNELIATIPADSSSSYNYDLSNLTTAGTYNISIKAVSDNYEFLSSNTTSLSYTRLSCPVLHISDTTLTWNAVTNATEYIIYLDGSIIDTVSANSARTIDISTYVTEARTYTIHIVAQMISNSVVLSSSISNNVTYTTLPTLQSPNIQFSSKGIISWDSVPNVEYYTIHIESQIVNNYTANTYDVGSTLNVAGNYDVYITAHATNYNASTSNTVTYIVLASPSITLHYDVISWQEVVGAEEYHIYCNDTYITKTSNTSYDLAHTISDIGTYSIYIKAINDGYEYKDNTTSNIVTYVHSTKLSSPVVSKVDYNLHTITWDSINNASSYKIYVDDSYITSTTNNSIDLSSIISDYELHTINIRAISNNSIYSDSSLSEDILYEISGENIEIAGYLPNGTPTDFVIYENSLLGVNSTLSISGNTLTWTSNSLVDYYVIMATNGNGSYKMIDRVDKNTNSVVVSNLSNYASDDIMAYTIISVIDFTDLYMDTFELTYYNPDNIPGYTEDDKIFAFNGDFHDYYIESQDELNELIYYSFLWRKSTIVFKTNGISVNPDTAHNSFTETYYYSASPTFDLTSGNVYTYTLPFVDTECNSDFTNTSSSNNNHTNGTDQKTYADTYDFDKLGRRDNTYNDFVSDEKVVRIPATTSEELLHIIESGYTPICTTASRAETIYNKAKDVLREIISDSMTDYEKALSIFDWITCNTIYDYTALDIPNNICNMSCPSFYLEGVFIHGLAVCDGFSKAFSLMCNMEGIDCIKISGDAGTNGNRGGHAWNKVRIDSNWYVVDITWTDLLVNSSYETLSHKYFMVTDSMIASTHYPCDRFKISNLATPATPYSHYNNTLIKNENHAIESDSDLYNTIDEIAKKKITYIDLMFLDSYLGTNDIGTLIINALNTYNSNNQSYVFAGASRIAYTTNYTYASGKTGIGVIVIFEYA
ncbi:MAG: hypothetical protein E7361_01895 [Clostridiales bacterium]|nr:hypothetical protein [Clostridiales bacterium]